MESETPVKVNKNTYLSVGIVILIVTVALWLRDGQTAGLQAALDLKTELSHVKEIRHLQDDIINTKVDALTLLVKNYGDDRYTTHDHAIFVDRLQELNPTIKVPKNQK